MNLPQLKQVLTDPDEFITNSDLKNLVLEVLGLVPMPGIEGSPLDSGDIMEVVMRAAVGTTSVNGVTTNTDETPNRELVMDWLQTLDREPIEELIGAGCPGTQLSMGTGNPLAQMMGGMMEVGLTVLVVALRWVVVQRMMSSA